jgi:Domain of unknown function (DUF4224)
VLLAQSEICRITGYMRPSAQARWLRRHGWRHSVNALGEPVVAVAEFNRHLVGGCAARQEPDYEALNGPT